MYFHAVKSTAHPPFIGALGHNTDCIVKQSLTFALQFLDQLVSKWSASGKPFGDPTRPFGDPTRPFGDLTTPFRPGPYQIIWGPY